MRSTSRFYYILAASFCMIVLLSIAIRVHHPTSPFTGELLGSWSGGFTWHKEAKTTYEWDPKAYDDLPLPALADWPGPDAEGHYNDWTDSLRPEEHAASNENQLIAHLVVRSKMTTTGRFMKIDWGGDHDAYNPGLIPHPEKADTWIVIGQKDKSEDLNTIFSVQLYCEAKFFNDTIKCTRAATSLPIASTKSKHCTKKIGLEWFNSNIGPHDARLFHGLEKPYIMYNQQAKFSCVGQWIHDARRLVDYTGDPPQDTAERFIFPTNIQKPGARYNGIEKNYFAFWDMDNNMYIHYSITPHRSFARLKSDGSVSPDLASRVAKHDDECMARLLPKLRDTKLEWIHQATNSLMITLCKRSDPSCVPDDDNTFIFTLFQTKTFYMHGQYEPYLMLWRRKAPFGLHAISKTPIWYHGKGKAFGNWRVDLKKPKDQAQMVFTTSMSWKNQGMTYHGYLDDELMICFGVEDKHSGVIDVTVGDLMADIATC